MCKHLSDALPIRSGLQQGHALTQFLFNFTSEYAIRKVHENIEEVELNGTHQLLVNVNDINLLVECIPIKK
jgi:hypothetical protein